MHIRFLMVVVLTVSLTASLEAGRKRGDWGAVDSETRKGTVLFITLKSGEKHQGVFLGSDSDYVDTVWERRSRDFLKADIKKVQRDRPHCIHLAVTAPFGGAVLATAIGGPIAKINKTAGIAAAGTILGMVAVGTAQSCLTKLTLYEAP